MSPLLKHLEDAGAGVVVGEKTILGFGWSDDLVIICRAGELDRVLRALEKGSGQLRKQIHTAKTHAVHLQQGGQGEHDA